MMRLPTGGRIDRENPISVTFNGSPLNTFSGDTLASALLASGESVVARSFKYHRPRGVYSAGVEEPSALVHVGYGAQSEPNARATTTEVFDGLASQGQNAWPNVGFDIGAVNDVLSPVLGAGFYYKTFIGPMRGTGFWMFCEKFIRQAAGMGRAEMQPDPETYERRYGFCDVLIIGGGVAGLSAALSAGRAGVDTILVDQDFVLGGAALSDPVGGPSDAWLKVVIAELQTMQNVRILTRTTAFGAYDGNTYGLVERCTDHLAGSNGTLPRQRFWIVRAKRSILATGAIERPLIFGGNDRPGVMLANAAQTYVNRYAVLPGKRVVVVTNNDSAYEVAATLANAGARVVLADLRPEPDAETALIASQAGVEVLKGHGVVSVIGRRCVSAARIVPIGPDGRATGAERRVDCDLLVVSGGWSPTLHLWSHIYGKPSYRDDGFCFVPDAIRGERLTPVGSAAGACAASECIAQGFVAGLGAAKTVDPEARSGEVPVGFSSGPGWYPRMSPLWAVFDEAGKTVGKAFVDIQHDVKLTDIDQAVDEGYVSVEHLKRYTTSGMATDQGKLSNIAVLTRLAERRAAKVPAIGTTTFRPPFTPVSIGALAGHDSGAHFAPTRRTPIHNWHVSQGAVMTEAGAWMRPWYYPKTGETLRSAYIREAGHVRTHVGIVDVSTLGKITVQGPDAAEFLNRVYVNGWKTLAIGRLRYGIMLREDGFVLDDGATARLGEHDYFMTTTTANAAKILSMAEHLLQTAWRDLRVHVTSVTDQWAVMAVAGPNARALLQDATTGADLSRQALPNNHFVEAQIVGCPVRVHRMSYSGELAYEVYSPSGFALAVWQSLIDHGVKHRLQPYGTEAMGALRIEKGHIAGPEIDGRTTLADLGMDGMASGKKPFVGSVLRGRPLLLDEARPCLVGLEIQGNAGAKPGSLLFAAGKPHKGHGEGWVSSTTFSPALGANIALALLENGAQRHGETIEVVDLLADSVLSAKVVSSHFFDPESERQNG